MTQISVRGALAAALLLAVASGTAQAQSLPFGAPADPAAATRTVEVVMRDNYFEPDALSVKAGDVVRFVIRNEGSALHQFHLGTAAMQAEEQKHMAMMVDHGMVGQHGMDHGKMKMDHGSHATMPAMTHDAPNSVLVEPGKTVEVVWRFAAGADDLEVACTMPGHYEAGMTAPVAVGR
ncbi:cupredoxin domain-containing protein [Caenispirillum bisanense]|uniref:Uncharacterized copper-binding protein, cupredoxin-like subfamily n=1 Tax=Caenispirillum bisanense TaxID=414052 RepID=A0A286GVM7_9PROT|nr:cupredoxin domain-containing protein [Caenispirillum bisanense]SOD99593.1 Uncharacterized copper-binding protein, cupredoxin-like subfamily [Caenispirillum bisanense]